ncbi:transposase [Candidatus Woesearchaeota archaeon]|nr:transposase [Candidatus Woesearchaeota archaeon]
MRKLKQYDREFKLSVLQELETNSLTEVCRNHNISPSTVAGWKKVYKNNPKEAFKGNGKSYKEEVKIAEYERVIGRLYAQNDLLKRAYEAMKEQVADELKKKD